MLYTLYRISDKGNKKNKLKHADKLHCLQNYIGVFGKENLVVFADNCHEQTVAGVKSLGVYLIELPGLGNSLSFLKILDYALDNFKDDDNVYFLEDDYLHLNDAKQVLLEGLGIADYVTLYDSPDKYIAFNKGGYNHYILENGEETTVLLTKSAHWKITISATMTFACSIKILKEDYKTWQFYTTQDYQAFQRLAYYPLKWRSDIKVLKNKLHGVSSLNFNGLKQWLRIIFNHYKNKYHKKKRVLIVSIPARATHTEVEFLAPLINWSSI
ncbi:MAG: hypothetical protein JWP94_1112 [Mucilaginibacter sp.]|nr:hypothetical protein [Mucilaginibacter sp.]